MSDGRASIARAALLALLWGTACVVGCGAEGGAAAADPGDHGGGGGAVDSGDDARDGGSAVDAGAATHDGGAGDGTAAAADALVPPSARGPFAKPAKPWHQPQPKTWPITDVIHGPGADDAGDADDADAGNDGDAAAAPDAAPDPCDPATPAGPPPTPSCPPPATKLFGAQPPPAETLQVEIGAMVEGAFVPWQPGEPRPMVHGPQGGLHLVASARVRRLDGQPLPEGSMWLESVADVGCNAVTKQKLSILKTAAAPGVPGARLVPDKSGIWLVLPSPASLASTWCGAWLRVTLRAKTKDGLDRGGTSLVVRVVDS